MDTIEAYPFFLNKPLPVTVNNSTVETRIISSEWVDFWRPLLQKIHDLHTQHPKRLMIGIGGPPGTGKSVLTAQLVWIIEKGFLRGCRAIALPMDGFHFPNEYLRTHSRTMSTGVQIPLLNVKGAPDTFDVESLRQHLQQLRTGHHEVPWPDYSRQSHDVIPNFFHADPAHNVVFVEGNYLLLNRGPWTGIGECFDLKIYLETPAVAIVSALLQRHIAGGRNPAMAKEWVKRIDLPNARIAESTKRDADLVIERGTDHDILAAHWKQPTPAEKSA